MRTISGELFDAVVYMSNRYNKRENAFVFSSDEQEEFNRNADVIKKYYDSNVRGNGGVIPVLHSWLLSLFSQLHLDKLGPPTRLTKCPNCQHEYYVREEKIAQEEPW